MKRSSLIALCGLMLASPALLAATPATTRSFCFSSGPVENIAESGDETNPDAPLVLAAQFFTVNLLNNSAQPVQFEARFFQIDGPGSFENPPGDWPKPKVENFYGIRPVVPANGSQFLNSDWSDDPEPVYGYEAQVKITGDNLRRNQLLLTGHARAPGNLKIAPEHRITNQEWTQIRCTW